MTIIENSKFAVVQGSDTYLPVSRFYFFPCYFNSIHQGEKRHYLYFLNIY